MAAEHGLGAAQGTLMVDSSENPCQSCGACCSYSANWPRFTIEDDATLDLIPAKYVNERQSGMRCDGDRCSALSGKIGETVRCTIYAVRPEVCRTCMPGDAECNMARRRHGLALIASG
jgi:Fe-S-cluster containining protein